MLPTALVVITHETPDDVDEYDRLWAHMNDDARCAFSQCSRATILLWNAIAASCPARCSLRRVQSEYFIIHINIYHAIEQDRWDTIAYEEECFHRTHNEACDTYGHKSNSTAKSFVQIFHRAVHVVEAALHHCHPFVRSIAFFDEQMVARTSHRNVVQKVFSDLYVHERILVLCDFDERHRYGVARPEDEPSLTREDVRLREDVDVIFPKAFIVPASVVAKMSVHFQHKQEAKQNMCYISIRKEFGADEVCPTVFFPLHDYLAPHALPEERHTIEDAIARIQETVREGRCTWNDSAQQPDMIHKIWIGGEMHKRWKQFHQKTIALHGVDHVRLYGNHDLHPFAHTLSALPLFHSYSSLTDLLRLELLYKHGGYYIDTDFDLYHSLFTVRRSLVCVAKEHVPLIQKYMPTYKAYTGSFLSSSKRNLFMLLYMSYFKRYLIRDLTDGWISAMSGGPLLVQSMVKSLKHLHCSPLRRPILSVLPTSFLYDPSAKTIHSGHGCSQSGIGRHMYACSWR
jgi:hypothetical protein